MMKSQDHTKTVGWAQRRVSSYLTHFFFKILLYWCLFFLLDRLCLNKTARLVLFTLLSRLDYLTELYLRVSLVDKLADFTGWCYTILFHFLNSAIHFYLGEHSVLASPNLSTQCEPVDTPEKTVIWIWIMDPTIEGNKEWEKTNNLMLIPSIHPTCLSHSSHCQQNSGGKVDGEK